MYTYAHVKAVIKKASVIMYHTNTCELTCAAHNFCTYPLTPADV
jgi:hypothetical protein